MASRMAAVVLQVLQPATALLIVVTNQSHTLFSFHPPLMATAFLGFIGQGVLTSLAVRGLEGEKRGQLLIRHALWYVQCCCLDSLHFVALVVHNCADKAVTPASLPHALSCYRQVSGLLTMVLGIWAAYASKVSQSRPLQRYHIECNVWKAGA